MQADLRRALKVVVFHGDNYGFSGVIRYNQVKLGGVGWEEAQIAGHEKHRNNFANAYGNCGIR